MKQIFKKMYLKQMDFEKKTIIDFKEMDFNEMDFKKMDFNERDFKEMYF